MGITGLLPFLERATKPCHVSEFRGATVVIDTYCWLHRGANACAVQLAQGEDTQIYVDYCLKFVKMLQSYNIRPILVFDGKNLPAKADTEAKRRESRNKAKQRAAELLRIGKTDEARTYLKQSINVTPEMASAVIRECRKINVDCIVAPYECDAQLAYFNLKGIAEVVITEDSDLVLFGCSKVMYKLDLRGTGYLVEADKIPEAMKLRPDKYTFDKFRYMCILSGCDYIESLRGIGLQKAKKFITLTEETNPEIVIISAAELIQVTKCDWQFILFKLPAAMLANLISLWLVSVSAFLDKLPRYLNMRHLQITSEYKKNFMIADATFRHQIVFDPFKKKLVPLTDPEVSGTNPEHCKNAGAIFDHELAYQVALGNLHPTTLKRLDNWSPVETSSISNSIWSGCYKKSVSRKVQKAQFREFFKSSTKEEATVDLIQNEQIKIEEEKKVAKELEFYSKTCSKPEKPSSTSEIDVETPESPKRDSLSPVLKTNPFIVEKKLSRFHRTNTSTQVIVKSRYFSSESKIKEEISEVKEESTTSEYNELSNVENIPINRIAGIKVEDSPTEENKSSQNETDRAKSEDNLYLTIDETDLEIRNEIIEVADDVLELNTFQKITEESSSSKRKKIGSCRPVGLKRTKSEGQKTIQQFFKKLSQK